MRGKILPTPLRCKNTMWGGFQPHSQEENEVLGNSE